ncbi:MAG: ABC transporter substrate-binding protein [Polyangiaceae bacterium]|nr:ABC transporter substrate-binding protein [Polyangiaceae bacterium]
MLARRALLAGLTGLAACKRGGAPSGLEVARVVSLSPSTTEAVYALGAGARLVGRSRYCDYPAEAARLPAVGGYVDPNLEAILALRPRLVTGARGPAGPALRDRLAALGVETYFPPTESVAEIDAMLRGLGARLGVEAGPLCERVSAELDLVRERARRAPHPRALLLFGVTPVVAAGPGSFADELLTIAGGINVVAGTTTAAYPTLDLERVLTLDPDVVLDAATEEHGDARLSSAWRAVRAVRERRVVALSDPAVLRPGPRVGRGAARIAAALAS